MIGFLFSVSLHEKNTDVFVGAAFGYNMNIAEYKHNNHCNVFTKTDVVKVYLGLCTSTPFCSVEIFMRCLRLRKHLDDEGLMEYVCVAAVHLR